MTAHASLDEFTTALAPGSGVAARLAGVALFCPPGSDNAGVERLLATVGAVAGQGVNGLGLRLARRLAGLLRGEEGDAIPDFGMVAQSDDRFVLFLYGRVAATVSGPESTDVSGASAATWVDRVLPSTIAGIELRADGAAPGSTSPLYDLGSGVVPAEALLIARAAGKNRPFGAPAGAKPAGAQPSPLPPADAPAPPPPPPPPPEPDSPHPPASRAEMPEPDADVDFQSVDLSSVSVEAPRQPLPVDSGAADAVAGGAGAPGAEVEAIRTDKDDPGGTQVDGIVCSRGHLNNPEGSYCSVCGISMVHQTHNLVRGRRPPLGFLVFDDGATYSLDDSYVIGREPDDDQRVEAGEARPLAIDDPDRSISRVHAEVSLVGWEVIVRDRGSTNGTYVWDGAQQRWEPVAEGQKVVLQPASRVAVGQRTFVYETPHRGRL